MPLDQSLPLRPSSPIVALRLPLSLSLCAFALRACRVGRQQPLWEETPPPPTTAAAANVVLYRRRRDGRYWNQNFKMLVFEQNTANFAAKLFVKTNFVIIIRIMTKFQASVFILIDI